MSDHKATHEADQVKESGKKAYSEADQGRGGGSTNPMMNRASAEALPKIFSPLAAATSPMKTRADAGALPKIFQAESARSSEKDEPLNNAGMAKRKRPMAGCGTTAARCARKAQEEEVAPGWNRSWDDDSHHIVAEALKALAGDEGGLPDLNFMRCDYGHDVGARAIAALRDDTVNVDPNDPSNDGCDSSLALEESEESDLGNSWDSSNVDPEDPYGGGCGSSLGSEEEDARDVQDPTDDSGGGLDSS